MLEIWIYFKCKFSPFKNIVCQTHIYLQVARVNLCPRMILEPFSFSSFSPSFLGTWQGSEMESRLESEVRTAAQPYSLPSLFTKGREVRLRFTFPPQRIGELVFRTMFIAYLIEEWSSFFKVRLPRVPTTVLHLLYIHIHTLLLFMQSWEALIFWASRANWLWW